MLILQDPAHGHNTPGKCSPDGRFLEAQFNREISRNIVCELKDRGYDAELLVNEDTDIPLKERVSRANAPKFFMKYFFVNTKTGEKSGEMLTMVRLDKDAPADGE